MKKKTFKTIILFLFGITTHFMSQAQSKTVKGRITDEKGAPVQGATIQAKGGTAGTSSSETGVFSLVIPVAADSLEITRIGYVDQAVAITGETLEIHLMSNASKLDEVVVIGYGTARKSDLTGPVTTVNTENMLKRTTATAMDALQGAVPGVQVVSSGGPGSSPTVRIRGVGSFNNEAPLYVVDGAFFNDIGFLNADDIADMSILKDASGAAIYGVRAANGVVLITTKKGRLNMKPQVTYNGYVGWQVPSHVVKMANGTQFTDYALKRETGPDSSGILESVRLYGGSGLSPATNTDWYRAVLRKSALMTNHGINIQGGGDRVTYAVGFNYTYQNGIMKAKNDFTRYNGRVQLEVRTFPWLKVGLTSIFNNATTFNPNNGVWLSAYQALPIIPVYDSVNNPNAFPVKFSKGGNAVSQAYYNFSRYKQFQFLPTIYAEAAFWKNKITFRSQLAQTYFSGLGQYYNPAVFPGPGSPAPNSVHSHLTSNQDRTINYIFDNTLTYKDTKGAHHWNILLGQSARSERYRFMSVGADDVPAEEEFWYVKYYKKSDNFYDETGSYNTAQSYFGRVSYDYNNKYLLTGTIRYDGSSKYQTKWGTFPSVGLGWVISKEGFMKNQRVFDLLKLRGTWGKLGNDGVNANAGYAQVYTGNGNAAIFGSTANVNGTYVPGYTVNNFFANLGWEVVEEWDGGIDFEALNKRLNGSVDYYNRKTNGAALSRPFAFGAPSIYGNWANMTNSGLEIVLNWRDKIGEVGYAIGGNVSTTKNNVTFIGASLDNIATGYPEWTAEFPTRIRVGQPINYFYGYVVEGIYQTQAEVNNDPVAVNYNKNVSGNAQIQPGFFKFKDLNGNGILDPADRTNIGSYLPKINYGLSIALDYKKVDFSIVIAGVSGNKILNLNRGRFVKAQASPNLDADFIEHLWTGEGSTNSYPSALALAQPWNKQPSSFFTEDGAYVRIQNIQLGYTFKLSKIRSDLRVFATADRPVTFTKYHGFTPEVAGGFDAQVSPMSATYTFGVKATF
ncbi:MAG: TonB-dependent receptor [Niabella sp.]|nr:TonB-dependent receptor [Niabella sp.]